MNYSALIVAGGKGLRMGLGYNKVFFHLKDGASVLDTTLQVFMKDECCKQIVVVTNPDDLHQVTINRENGRIVHVGGGETRQESVLNGLMAITEDVVLIHDAARPWVNQAMIDSLLNVMSEEQAVLPMVSTKDVIKEVKGGYVEKTLKHMHLMQAQTPQAFKTGLILKCIHRAQKEKFIAKDDAQLIEKYSDVKIRVIEGDYANVKITTIEDVNRL